MVRTATGWQFGKHKKSIIISLSVLCITIFVFLYLVPKFLLRNHGINSYEDCIQTEGSVLQATYPATCITEDGQKFTEKTETSATDALTKSAECYDKSVNSECKYGSRQCGLASPASAYCICMGGEIKIKEKSEELCIINGQEREVEEYFKATIPRDNDLSNISKRDLDEGWYYGSLKQKKPGTPTYWIHVNEGYKSAAWRRPEIKATPLPTLPD